MDKRVRGKNSKKSVKNISIKQEYKIKFIGGNYGKDSRKKSIFKKNCIVRFKNKKGDDNMLPLIFPLIIDLKTIVSGVIIAKEVIKTLKEDQRR